MIRVLVVGQGLMGRKRAEAIRTLSERLPVCLAGTVDPVAPANWAAIPSEDLFDAAIVAVPHDVAGKVCSRLSVPVLVEKPAFGVTDGFVGFNYRFLPHVQGLLELLPTLGRLRSVDMLLGHGGHPDSAEGWKLDPVRAGGGVLLDPGCHLFDLMRLIAPDLIPEHTSTSTGFWGTGVEEDALVTFTADGMVGSVRVSHLRWVNTFRIEVFGEDGYAIAEGRGGNYGPPILRVGERWGWRSGPPQRETETVHRWDEDTSILAETEAAVRCWLGESPAQKPAAVWEARMALRTLTPRAAAA